MAITQTTILPLKYGMFIVAYHKTSTGNCVSASYGDLQQGTPIVRLHSSCLFGESFHGLDCECASQLDSTFKLIKKHGAGVIVYKYAEGRGIGLEQKIEALELQRTRHIDTVEAFKLLGFEPDVRTYDTQVAALKDLKVSNSIKVASQNPHKIEAIRAAGYHIAGQLHPKVRLNQYNVPELLTKKELLGYNIQHKLEIP